VLARKTKTGFRLNYAPILRDQPDRQAHSKEAEQKAIGEAKEEALQSAVLALLDVLQDQSVKPNTPSCSCLLSTSAGCKTPELRNHLSKNISKVCHLTFQHQIDSAANKC